MKLLQAISIGVLAAASVMSFAQDAKVQPTPAPADKVVADALKLAKSSDRNVMVIFHASWCGWCKRMDAFMSEPKFKDLFEKSYVVVHLDVMEQPAKKSLENAGGDVWMDKLGGAKAGLPFVAILDGTGKKLTDSNRPDPNRAEGQNIGHPMAPEEIAHYMMMLKSTAKHMSAEQLKSIQTWLEAQKK